MQAQKKKFHIADFSILIEGIDPDTLTKYMPNYIPFIQHEEEENMRLDIPSMHFICNQSIQIPSKAVLVDTPALNDVVSLVYQLNEATYILTVFDDKSYLMQANGDWTEIKCNISLGKSSDKIFFGFFLMTAIGVFASFRNTIKLHASVIEKDGNALLFMGRSGTGKSTHSRLWMQYIEGATLLNDDEPFVKIMDNGEVRVYGAPWSGSTPCYRNEWARVKGFVWLKQYSENKIKKLSALDAVTRLLQSTSVLRSNQEVRNNIFNTLSIILRKIPVYQLQCLPDEGAVRLTEKIMIQ